LGEDERGYDVNLSKREITASSFMNTVTASPRADHGAIIRSEERAAIINKDSLEDEPEVPSELNSRFE